MYSCVKQLVKIAASFNNSSSREFMRAVSDAASNLGTYIFRQNVAAAYREFFISVIDYTPGLKSQDFSSRFSQELNEVKNLLSQADKSIPNKLRKYAIEQENFNNLLESNQAFRDKINAFNAKIQQEIKKIFSKHDESFEIEKQLDSWSF